MLSKENIFVNEFKTASELTPSGNQNNYKLMASSAIAATLVPGGKSVYSTFKVHINLDLCEGSICVAFKNSNKTTILQGCALFVWNACTQTNKSHLVVEALNRTLQDIR